jgi:hypothetical protein
LCFVPKKTISLHKVFLHDFWQIIIQKTQKFFSIPKPVWAVGFVLEQMLRDAAFTCSVSGILKRLQIYVT